MPVLTVEGDFLCDIFGLDALLLVGDEDHAAAIYGPPVLAGPLLGNHGCHTNTSSYNSLDNHGCHTNTSSYNSIDNHGFHTNTHPSTTA